MRFTDLLSEHAIDLSLPALSREEVIEHLLKKLSQLPDPEAARDAVLERERALSTGVGQGVAVPHATLPGLEQPLAAFGRIEQGVDFGSMDGQPVRLIFLLLAPEEQIALHLKILSRISRLVSTGSLREELLAADDPGRIHAIFSKHEGAYQEL